MSDAEEDYVDNKFWHRKQCSNRVFIGPWDIKAPPPSEQFVANDIESITSIDSDSSMKLLNQHTFVNSKLSTVQQEDTRKDSKDTSKSPISPTSQIVTPSSDGTSFVTARSSKTNSTVYNGVDSTPHFLEHMVNNDDDDDEEIDYQFLADSTPAVIIPPPRATSSDKILVEEEEPLIDTDTSSIKTVRQGKLPMNPTTTTTSVSTHHISTFTKKKKKKHRLTHHSKKPLFWKKAGSVFVSRLPTNVTQEPDFVPTGKPIKHEPILCMRSVTGRSGSEPTRYKAAKEAKFDLLTEKWRQVELVLTNTCISTYSSSTMFWPKQRLEHRVYLEGNRKPKHLELFLLSSLDYTFCLRYLSNSTKIPMMVTLTFKAQSFLKCQEWYMQLYDMLPDENKRPCPKWCEVYIPMLELSVNLPLAHVKHSNDITMEDVKEAVITVLEEEQAEGNVNEKMAKLSSMDELGLCWATKDRAEWIYWTTSSSNASQRIDWVICPQSIEQTHRLELRTIEHTPHDIILKENFKLKEPPPVEGFLISVTDWNGLGSSMFNNNRKMNYFSTFDQYLFYTPAIKVSPPNMKCFIDEHLMPKNIRSRPYVSALSPYTQTCTKETEVEEVQRRMRLMTEAKGVIDLTEVSYVRRTFANDLVEEGGGSRNHSQVTFSKKPSRSPMIQEQPQERRSSSFFSSSQKNNRNKPCLELIMENGLQIKFEAYSSETCDLWVNYLAQIIVYWKARKEAEKDVHQHENSLINHNSNAKVSENTLIKEGSLINTEDGCVHRKQDKIADTRIWSYCLYEQCRDVVKSGILYYKPHKRGSYSQKMFVLTANGWILFYDVYNRSSTKPACNHERKGALDIAGCYFYSGVDSSKQKKGSNKDNRLKKAARLYGNGLATDDDTLACIFSIWKPKLRRYFSTKRQRLRVYRHDQRLNANGTTWTFLARSRREKEEWVCALNTVTEHMIRCDSR